MQIFISISDGPRSSLECESSDTIKDVKERIEKKFGHPVNLQALYYAGKLLEDDHTLFNYNIFKEATISCVLRVLRGRHDQGLRLVLRIPPRLETKEIYLPEDASVNDLRAKIENLVGVDQSRQRLIYGGRVIRLRDGHLKLLNLRIGRDAVIRVESISSKPYPVGVLMPDSEVIFLNVIYSEPVSQLKNLATESYALLGSEFSLTLKGEPLSPTDALADCYVDENSVVELVPLEIPDLDDYFEFSVEYNLDDDDGSSNDFQENPVDNYLGGRTELISSIKKKIEESTTFPAGLLELCHKGQVLRDEWTLESCSLKSKDTVIVKLLEEKEIVIRVSMRTTQVLLSNRSLISTLKQKLVQPSQDPSTVRLRYRGQLLQDTSSLASYHILSGDNVDIENSSPMPQSPPAGLETELERMRRMFAPTASAIYHPTSQAQILPSLPQNDLDTKAEDLTDTSSATEMLSHLDIDATASSSRGRASIEGDHRSITSSQPGAVRVDKLYGPHLLADAYDELSQGHWKEILERLPALYRNDIAYKRLDHLNSCWTLTPSSAIPPDVLPLTIAGCPVVVPVCYRYPLVGLIDPPPDPHPQPINPVAGLQMPTIISIFKTFEHTIGFYLLLNGLLQLVVPDGFDYEWASSYRPNYFGGLKICYLPQNMDPTATRTFTRRGKERDGPSINLDDKVEARVKDMKIKETYRGGIGLKTSFNDTVYLTMSSHVITSAVMAKAHKPFYRKWFGNSQPRLDPDWPRKVDIYSREQKIGRVVKTFDNDAGDYPHGFRHDLSLVAPDDPGLIRDVKSPIPRLDWLTEAGWANLRRTPKALNILNQSNRDAKSIPSLTTSQCLVVGEGIFLNRRKLAAASTNSSSSTLATSTASLPSTEGSLEFWTKFVSRSVLYRVHPDFKTPAGQSGIAIFTESGARTDGLLGPAVVGFQSFLQRSGHIQTFEMEGEDLEHRLKRGLVAFYGAFQVPEEIRTHHRIVD